MSTDSIQKEEKVAIGAVEHISLPDLGIKNIPVRVDTGARRSALHAANIRLKKIDGKRIVSFNVVTGERGNFCTHEASAELKQIRRFTSSNGGVTTRPMILTTFQLGEYVWKSQVSLIDRSSLRYRMLLGRMSIKNRFLVDVSSTFLMD